MQDSKPDDDVEAFLYGPDASKPTETTDLHESQPQEEELDEEDEDEVEIVLSAASTTTTTSDSNAIINSATSTTTNSNNAFSDSGGFLKMSAKQGGGGGTESGSNAAAQTRIVGGVDLGSIATLDGQSLLDVEIEGFEEKPWRKPGADITDYFNFGFNELTWKQYCYKQKSLREEFSKASTTSTTTANYPSENNSTFANPQSSHQPHVSVSRRNAPSPLPSTSSSSSERRHHHSHHSSPQVYSNGRRSRSPSSSGRASIEGGASSSRGPNASSSSSKRMRPSNSIEDGYHRERERDRRRGRY